VLFDITENVSKEPKNLLTAKFAKKGREGRKEVLTAGGPNA
jgi:hypothetical protein